MILYTVHLYTGAKLLILMVQFLLLANFIPVCFLLAFYELADLDHPAFPENGLEWPQF